MLSANELRELPMMAVRIYLRNLDGSSVGRTKYKDFTTANLVRGGLDEANALSSEIIDAELFFESRSSLA